MKNKGKLYSITLASIAFVFFCSTCLSSIISIACAHSTDGQLAFAETQITTNIQEQWDPAIYGNRVVWTDSRNSGHYDIYMYDVSNKNEIQITNSGSTSTEPAIYEDKIVWMDYRNENYDIYMYNVSTSKETQITTNNSDQMSPTIYENNIVWYDLRNGNSEIYMYNLSASTETRITIYESDKVDPVIYGDRIVWTDHRNGNWDIYMYDLSTSNETQITKNLSDEYSPAIYGDKIVCRELNGNSSIHMYNLTTSIPTQITTNKWSQEYPDIYGDLIAWTDARNVENSNPLDIYMYDISTSTETRVTTSMSYESSPAIYGDRIVWTDWRNGSGDIYMATLYYIPLASFSANPILGASPLKVYFNDTSTGSPTAWNWSFGDGTYSASKNPVHTYSKAGKYVVSLTASNENGTNSTTQKIIVLEEFFPVANFKANVTSGYAPLSVQFNDTSLNATAWNWDFGDGNTSFDQNPVNTYFVAGDYTVNLTVSNENGTSSTLGMINVLKPVIPVANFTSNVTKGYSPLTVQFTDLSKNAAAWNWDFGDTTNSTERNPVHTYSTTGTYTVNLTVSNRNGTDSKPAVITVNNALPVANFSMSVTGGYAPLSVTFADLSQRATLRNWDFGDGTSSTDKNPTHTYSMIGKYVVSLTVNNTNGTVSKSSIINVLPVQHIDGQFTFTETRITTNESFQDSPDIYGNIIVWDDWRNGNGDVYMYDTSTCIETQITTNRSDQMESTIYGDRIIWIDGRSQNLDNYSILGNFDIWMYNLSTREETQVTTSESCKHYPKIYDNKIVWEDRRNGDSDIYIYDLSTSKETRIPNSGSASNPDIYGDRIVWEDYRNSSPSGDSDIYIYDLSTSKESQITTNSTYQFRPIIYKDKIAWMDWRNGGINNSDIYMYDISTSKETQITTNGSVQLSPAIYEDKIVWEDRRNGRGDIYVYDFSALKEARVTLSERSYSPAIYGDKIVWTDWRNQNPDIFMCTVEGNLMDTEENDNSGTHGGSSGRSSGSGGGSPESAKNVEVKELCQVFITNGNPIKFDFTKNATCVVSVSFDAKKTVGKTTTIVEQLKNKSTLTSNLTEGEVYKYFNVWVGNSGFASSENIDNPGICFKVEKSWLQNESIDQDSITLNRYTNKTWEHLPVSLSGEDSKYLYFTAEVPGFSFFEITGKANTSTETVTEIEPGNKLGNSEHNTGNTESEAGNESNENENKCMPGFEVVCGIVGLLGVFLYRRR